MSWRGRIAIKSSILSSCALVAGLALATSMIAPAWASLGGDTVSILADQSAMQGTRKASQLDSYTVHEIQAANGIVVREYQSKDGSVFGVAWHGSLMPDLRQVLGSYYGQYAQAIQARNAARRGRGPITINQPGLIVELGGHMRAFVGKAYVPEKLPAGMRAEDIQ